jgi:hypothetical protein
MTLTQLLKWAKLVGPTDQEGKVRAYYAERHSNNKIKQKVMLGCRQKD